MRLKQALKKTKTVNIDVCRFSVLFGILSSDSNHHIERGEMIRFLKDWDDQFQEIQIQSLFAEVQ